MVFMPFCYAEAAGTKFCAVKAEKVEQQAAAE
jgi:hypothetical protein